MITLTRRSTLTALGGALAMPYVRRARAGSGTLNFYSWADYIGETTLEDFASETGIEVVFDAYSSSEEMQAKMLAGSTGYDVVDMSSAEMPRFVPLGLYLELDKSRLPGWSNLDAQLLRILDKRDRDGAHGMPYMWGSVGFTYNLDMVRERLGDAALDDMDVIFKPENAARLADCGISILDSPTDIMPIVLKYLGLDGDTKNVADYDKVVAAFDAIRPYIRTFDNQNYINAIPNGELCVINNWSGDYATAQARAVEAGVEINLGYFVPKTGAPSWFDVLCIPSDAANVDNAYLFLDYMLRPEVAAACSNYTNYATVNLAAKAFVDPAILANPAVYPDAETITRLWAMDMLDADQDRALNRAWSRIKSG